MSQYQICGIVNQKVAIYETDEYRTTFENLFKLYEWDPDFIYPNCKTSLHFLGGPLTYTLKRKKIRVSMKKFEKLLPLIML